MATVPSMRTWVDGEVITAAEMNANFRDPTNWLAGCSQGSGTPKPHGFARQFDPTTGPTVIGTNSWTSVLWDFEDVDTDSGFTFTGSPAKANHYEVNTAGYYLVTGHLNWDFNTTGSRAARLTKNLAIIPGAYESTLATDVATGLTVTAIVACVVGDDIALQGWQTSGVNLNTNLNYGFFRNETSYLDVAWFQST